VDKGRVAEIVQSTFLEDLGTSLEPYGLTKGNTAILGQKLRGNTTQSSQHSPSCMNKFLFTISLESFRISRQASSVPTVVTREFSLQVRGTSVVRIRSQP